MSLSPARWPRIRSRSRWYPWYLGLILWAGAAVGLFAQNGTLLGRILDPLGAPIVHVEVTLTSNSRHVRRSSTDKSGRFAFSRLEQGSYILRVATPGFATATQQISVRDEPIAPLEIKLQIAPGSQTITVSANLENADVLTPDPAQRVFVRDETLDANPGRPGIPVSIPGLPVETASGGIKAPQYFAPGVAGDHGEPIAQYIVVGSYLFPNNLSANAHGNGYSDPNLLVSAVIESVQTDGGAFNVREGNHSENLSEAFGLHSHLQPFATLTGDYRDLDLVAGWGGARSWIVLEASYGDGFLDRLEHRQQYKLNASRVFHLDRHQVTLFAVGYYGSSFVPGLTPINMPQLHDTIDPRQKDQTHTGLLLANDDWKLTDAQQISLSGFFRTYNLSLDSNFGDGLIRQSEFRTVVGGSSIYTDKFAEYFTLLAGIDYQRDAPRRLDLDHYSSTNPSIYGPFIPVTANNVTIGDIAPYVAIAGTLVSHLHYYAGFRRDEISFDNADLLVPDHSFNQWIGVNSPKATLSFSPRDHSPLPFLSISAGEAFFTNDPRIGSGTSQGTLVSRSHSYQFVADKVIAGTEFRLTLGHATTEASFAKIDPDTGLQFNQGPGRLRFLTISACRSFRSATLQSSYSQADARDLSNGEPIPEAPRQILDLLATLDRIPFRLQARTEFEYVAPKPLGDGFTGVGVEEFRFALLRLFDEGRMSLGLNLLIARGYAGQTTEVLALPDDPMPSERIVGVRLPSYLSLSYTYRFPRHSVP